MCRVIHFSNHYLDRSADRRLLQNEGRDAKTEFLQSVITIDTV